MKTARFIVFFVILVAPLVISGQAFNRKDSLRGSITPERAWWDLMHYDIELSVDIDKKFISGSNKMGYKVIKTSSVLQIDLQEPMRITGISQNGELLTYEKEHGAYFINLVETQKPNQIKELDISFEGVPQESSNPPWDGGIVWKKDKNQKPFVANANQLLGSSSWLPSKDIPYDEPDEGMQIKITAAAPLVSVANGRLLKKESNKNGTDSYYWKVSNPINGYGINMNIADYAHFGESYQGEKGPLDIDYYVLSYNLDKAKEQFKQVPMMLEAFEYWFGPYPFYEDGYKLVEVPYLGMEHQSSVTYGNQYENGYLGNDLSATGMGLKFDFIIIHESGHEWFANNITNYDVADMWIHEGFTTYSEVLYLDYHFGTAAGNSYLKGYRKRVQNDRPVIGTYEVNQRGSSDMYIKGAAMIHTLRQAINDEDKFRELLRGINRVFYHKTISSAQLENYIAQQTGLELQGFFDQYLRSTDIPEIQYRLKNKVFSYRYGKKTNDLGIRVRMFFDNKEVWLQPLHDWQNMDLTSDAPEIRIDDNFYIRLSKK